MVVWSEQGLGDAIQFSRYLPLLDAAGIPFFFDTTIADDAIQRLVLVSVIVFKKLVVLINLLMTDLMLH